MLLYPILFFTALTSFIVLFIIYSIRIKTLDNCFNLLVLLYILSFCAAINFHIMVISYIEFNHKYNIEQNEEISK